MRNLDRERSERNRQEAELRSPVIKKRLSANRKL